MATKLGLYQQACILVKQAPVTSLSQDNLIRRRLDDIYDPTLLWALSEGSWNFAIKVVAINSSEDVQPQFGFARGFEKPDDWVRTVSISSVETLYPPLGPGEFDDTGVVWTADCDPLYVGYVSSATDAGLDLSLWMPTFTRAVEYELAYRIAPGVTNMGDDALDALDKRRVRAMKDARSKDALNQASQRPPPGRLLQSRLGGSARTWVSSIR